MAAKIPLPNKHLHGVHAVGYGQRLRVQRSADVRVLKSQLDLLTMVVHSARFVGPVWAGVFAFFGSASFGHFGERPLQTAAILPTVIAAVMLVSDRIIDKYRRESANTTAERLRPWFLRFVGMQVAISAAWGVLPWVLWDPANTINHIFVWACVVCVLASFVVSRASHLDMLIASIVPVVLLSSLRFATADAFSLGFALLLPVCALLLFLDGRRMANRLDEDSRLRLEVEDLARELAEARDEALRKRFEAETSNASKTAFLANMSHELRTPLNAILGFSELIAKQCFGPLGSPRYTEYANDIHSSGSHLLSLINDLLDVAKIEAGRMDIEPRPLEARKTFEAALKIASAKARERNQELVIDVEPAAPLLLADERALKQILINLVSNAVKFTPEGGRISVIGSRARNGGFQLMVEDNGPGIPKDKLDKIFTPFSQVDNRYDRQRGGTGLGLSLVRGLAELHGGRAWIESEQGHGCRAYVVFPASKIGMLAKEEPKAAVAAA